MAGKPVNMLVSGIQIEFQQVGELTMQDFRDFESLTELWFNTFYNGGELNITTSDSGTLARQRKLLRHGHRTLQGADTVRDMVSTIAIQMQAPDAAANANTLTYEQTLKYTSVGDDPEGPEYYALLPYRNIIANGQYGRLLRAELIPFFDVAFPIAVPDLPGQNGPGNGTDTNNNDDEDDFWTLPVIIGVAAGGVVVVGAVLGGTYYLSQRRAGPPSPTAKKTPRPLTVGNPEPAEYMSGDGRSYLSASGEAETAMNFQESTVLVDNRSTETAANTAPSKSLKGEESKKSSVASYDGKRCACVFIFVVLNTARCWQ